MQYRRRLDLDIEEVRPDLDILRNASRELRTSTKFKETLKIVLVVGNTLNGSTFRGNAQGFQLGSLLKVIFITSPLCHCQLLTSPSAQRDQDRQRWLGLPDVAALPGPCSLAERPETRYIR